MSVAARPWRPAVTAVVSAVAIVLAVGLAVPAAARPAILGAGSASAIAGSYLVKLKDTASVRAHGIAARARALSNAHQGRLGRVWSRALTGFSVDMGEADATQLAGEPDVEYVE